MEEKICLFSRVSTNIQDLTSQEESLIQAAKNDGYSEEQFIIISEQESGVNNSIKDRIGITKAINAILHNNVKVIYCFELSRIARRLDVFYEFRTFLIEHKVQLIILQPSVKLLNNNGEIDENFSLVFSIFASLAEQEARLLKSRLNRGKAKKRKENKFCDSVTCYGYKNNKGVLEVITEEAEIVKHIFYEYNSGKLVEDIAKELVNKKILNKTASQAKGFVLRILHNCVYCGKNSAENRFFNTNVKQGYTYPAIISEYEFNKADATFSKRKKSCKIHSKHIWMCRGLLVNERGESYHVHTTNETYYTLINKNDYTRIKSIKRKVIDDFIWNLVVDKVINKPLRPIEERRNELNIKLSEIELEYSEVKSQISDYDSKIKKVEYRILYGKVNEELGDEIKAEFIREKEKLVKELNEIGAHRDTLKEKIYKLSDSDVEVTREELEQYSDEEKERLIKEEVKSIVAVKNSLSEVTIGVMINECDDPEIFKLKYREYNKNKGKVWHHAFLVFFSNSTSISLAHYQKKIPKELTSLSTINSVVNITIIYILHIHFTLLDM